MQILTPKYMNYNFSERGYTVVPPNKIENENERDTIFYSAGIQPLLQRYSLGDFRDQQRLFIAQPVVRTQFLPKLKEGTGLAFVNATTASFNLSETEYLKLVKDWLELFAELGFNKEDITRRDDIYKDTWDGMEIEGKRTFYYYRGIEIGDTTFFTQTSNPSIETFCDLGFGAERLRWSANKDKSYFDIESDSSDLPANVKGLISAISLLALNGVKPANKNAGYRAKVFSKTLAEALSLRELNERELSYVGETVRYWQDWQQIEGDADEILKMIDSWYTGNCHRLLINQLAGEYPVSGIKIEQNGQVLSRGALVKKLTGSGVSNHRIPTSYRGE